MDFSIWGYDIMAWQFFASMCVVFIFLEVFVPGFVMLPIGIASLLTAPFTFFFDNWLSQLLIFGFNLIAVFVIFIKLVRPKIKKERFKTNIETLVGSYAEVTESFSGSKTGYVKLYGDRWQAYSDDHADFKIGDRVEIVRLDGNKVVVRLCNNK